MLFRSAKLMIQYGTDYYQQIKPKIEFLKTTGILESKAGLTSMLLELNVKKLAELLEDSSLLKEAEKAQGN